MKVTAEYAYLIAESAHNKLKLLPLTDPETYVIESMANSHKKYAEKHYGTIDDAELITRLSLGFEEGIFKSLQRFGWDGKEPAEICCAVCDYIYAEILTVCPQLDIPVGFGNTGIEALKKICIHAFDVKSFDDLPIDEQQTKYDQFMTDVKHLTQSEYGDYGGIENLIFKVSENTATARESAQLLCEYQVLCARQEKKLFFRFKENKRRAALIEKIAEILALKYPDTDLLSVSPNSVIKKLTLKETLKKLDEQISAQEERLMGYTAEPVEEYFEDSEINEKLAEIVSAEESVKIEDIPYASDVTVEKDEMEDDDMLIMVQGLPEINTQKIVSDSSEAILGAMSALTEDDYDEDDYDEDDYDDVEIAEVENDEDSDE